MSQIKISIAVMAHPSRAAKAKVLYDKVTRMPFHSVSLVYDEMDNEWSNGKASLVSHTDSDWHVVIQDDAIISLNFYDNVKAAIENVPQQTLISFYTGRVRPKSMEVTRAVSAAESKDYSWLWAYTLMWGVGIAIPTNLIRDVIKDAETKDFVYDRRIGWYFNKRRLPVYYTYPSIVDHDYKMGSLLNNDYAELPRVAHVYEPRHIKSWNSKAVKI